jgi:hypothetical protein
VTVIFKALKIKKLIEKIVNNDIVKTVIAFVKTNPKLVKVSTMALTGIAVVLVALNATGVTFAFNVTHSGHKLGTVGSPSVFNKARNIAVENVSSENADGAVCSPKLFLTLAVSDKLDDAKKVAEALIQNSEDVFNGSALIINGETVACVNASGLDKLLEARLKSYYISDAENSSVFTADVKVETGYFIKEDMSDVAEVEAIINALEVKTTTSYNTDESIPYSTTRIKTDTQPMGYYKVTTDYILGRTDSRTGLESSFFQDREEDGIYNTTTIYRAAIFIHERMNTGSALAGDSADFLYSLTLYRTLFTAAQKGYIPKRWFSLPPKIAESLPMAVTEGLLMNFPDKSPNAKRYGSPEPKSIETVIKTVENYIKKAATDIIKAVD